MLDLSSAFNAVDHDILLSGLNHKIGIKWRVLEWSASHLSKRSQFISVNSGRSRHFDVACGVLQVQFFFCIILGPLLCVLSVSKLETV